MYILYIYILYTYIQHAYQWFFLTSFLEAEGIRMVLSVLTTWCEDMWIGSIWMAKNQTFQDELRLYWNSPLGQSPTLLSTCQVLLDIQINMNRTNLPPPPQRIMTSGTNTTQLV